MMLVRKMSILCLYFVLLFIAPAPASTRVFSVESAEMNHVLFEAPLDFQSWVRAPLRVDRRDHDGACPIRIPFQAAILSNGPGTARYVWVRSDGATGPEETVTFRRRETRIVRSTWTLGGDRPGSVSGWAGIQLVYPARSQTIRLVEFNVRCR